MRARPHALPRTPTHPRVVPRVHKEWASRLTNLRRPDEHIGAQGPWENSHDASRAIRGSPRSADDQNRRVILSTVRGALQSWVKFGSGLTSILMSSLDPRTLI